MAIASRDYEGRARCINLGACVAGCAQGAKASADITYWPLALRAGVELRTRCRVREIVYDKATGHAAGVVYYDPDGIEQYQAAEVVILAGNGIIVKVSVFCILVTTDTTATRRSACFAVRVRI